MSNEFIRDESTFDVEKKTNKASYEKEGKLTMIDDQGDDFLHWKNYIKSIKYQEKLIEYRKN